MDRRVRLHRTRILFPQLVRCAVTGLLHQVHCLRFPCVLFALTAGFIETTNRQNIRFTDPTGRVNFFCLTLDTIDPDTGNPALHAWEIFRTHRTRQSNGFKIQTPAIRRDYRNPHLRHDLQQTLVDSIAVPRNSLGQCAFQQTAFNTIIQAVFGQIGVHNSRTAANQHGKIMRVNTFGRPHVDRCECAQTFTGQPRMHSRRRQNHRRRNLVFILMLIRQHQMPSA